MNLNANAAPGRAKRSFGGGFDAVGGPHEMVANRPEKPHEETVDDRREEIDEAREKNAEELSAGIADRFQAFRESAADSEKPQGSTKLPISIEPADADAPVKYPVVVAKTPEPANRVEILGPNPPLGFYGEAETSFRFAPFFRFALYAGIGFAAGYYARKRWGG